MTPEWFTNTTGSTNNIILNNFERWDTLEKYLQQIFGRGEPLKPDICSSEHNRQIGSVFEWDLHL